MIGGFQTGDMVRAEVPKGKHAGIHVGRVAVRASGSFRVGRPTASTGSIAVSCSAATATATEHRSRNACQRFSKGARIRSPA
jgi:hypothetical protein